MTAKVLLSRVVANCQAIAAARVSILISTLAAMESLSNMPFGRTAKANESTILEFVGNRCAVSVDIRDMGGI